MHFTTGSDSEPETADDPELCNQERGTPCSSANQNHAQQPNATLPKLRLAQDMLENIRLAEIEDDIKSAELLASLSHPASESEELDAITKLSIDIFIGLTGGSQQFYHNVRDALLRWNSNIQLHSYYIVRSKVEKITGVTKIKTDMCSNSCLAYTGPFSTLDQCPNCQLPRYEKVKGKNKPVKQFVSIPLGPMLQALWRTPEGADRMRYRNRKTHEVMQQLNQNHGIVTTYEDVFHGLKYINAIRAGKINPDDTLIFFSLDGAQLQ